ncbi:hypothetical protein Bbelb_317990 [Branchiostoma belcheri]|nr:hypothetical protein Bbelb_334260 [Branchiostoma belcheri]KAI8490531.1 hypothetical protein Bbelb_317990 [Branchiostoma belcheri]
MAAPVPVLRGDVTLVGCSLMEVWKKPHPACLRLPFRRPASCAFTYSREKAQSQKSKVDSGTKGPRQLRRPHPKVQDHPRRDEEELQHLHTSLPMLVDEVSFQQCPQPTGRIRTLRDTLVDGLRDDAVMRQLKRQTRQADQTTERLCTYGSECGQTCPPWNVEQADVSRHHSCSAK